MPGHTEGWHGTEIHETFRGAALVAAAEFAASPAVPMREALYAVFFDKSGHPKRDDKGVGSSEVTFQPNLSDSGVGLFFRRSQPNFDDSGEGLSDSRRHPNLDDSGVGSADCLRMLSRVGDDAGSGFRVALFSQVDSGAGLSKSTRQPSHDDKGVGLVQSMPDVLGVWVDSTWGTVTSIGLRC